MPAIEALAYDDRMTAWYRDLPLYLKDQDQRLLHKDLVPGINNMFWRYHGFRMLLFRPFLIDWALAERPVQMPCISNIPDVRAGNFEERCRLLCLDNAQSTIRSIQESYTETLETPMSVWYAT